MLATLRKLFYRQTFQPNALSVLINPNFFMRRAIHTSVASYAPKLQGKLLDFGCGTKPYRHLFSNSEYIGVDLAVNEGHSNSTAQVDVFYDGKSLPFDNESFDCAYSSEVFEHVFNLESMLGELHRVLRPGAKMLITIPFCWPEHEQPNDFARYTTFGIRTLADRCGFTVLQQQKKGPYIQCLAQLTTYGFFNVIPGNGLIKTLVSLPVTFLCNLGGLLLAPLGSRDSALFLHQVVLFERR